MNEARRLDEGDCPHSDGDYGRPTATGQRERTVGSSGAERARVDGFGDLGSGLRDASPWYLWGPYLSERQWGTVREDYSRDRRSLGLLPS